MSSLTTTSAEQYQPIEPFPFSRNADLIDTDFELIIRDAIGPGILGRAVLFIEYQRTDVRQCAEVEF